MSHPLKKFFVRLVSRKYSFRAHILALFLSLFIFSFACILAFTYVKNYRSVLNFSQAIADKTTALFRDQFETIASASERITRVSVGFLPALDNLDVHNPILRSFLLNVIKNDPHFSNVYVGFPNGTSIGAMNLHLYPARYFIKPALTSLDKKIHFAIVLIDATQSPSSEIWQYFDSDLTEIASETILPSAYHPLQRPWYQGAVQTKHLFWTGLYQFVPSMEKGISISNPLFIDGALKAVIGADISFKLLSNSLLERSLQTAGQAFILDPQGEIILPISSSLPPASSALVSVVNAHLSEHPHTADFVFTYEKIRYLSFVTTLPDLFGTNWRVVAITPLNDFIGTILNTQNQTLLFILIIAALSTYVIILFSKRFASPIITLSKEIHKIKELDLSSTIRVHSHIEEISRLDRSMTTLRRAVESFSKYIPKTVVEKLFDLNHPIVPEGTKREVTIFFSDITNFVSIVESEPIDLVMTLLTDYFHFMSQVILEHEGTIDKFIGDGIMAFWGAPSDIPDHTHKACEAALICQARLLSFNAARRAAGKPEFPTRFGIHVGTVIIGNIGTKERLNYTAIGDAVNMTARLQEIDKVYHTAILISAEVRQRLSTDYVLRPLDQVSIKGKTHPIPVYELLGKWGPCEEIHPSAAQIDLCTRFTHAYHRMEKGDLMEAEKLFSALHQDYPDDFPTQLHLKRIQGERKRGF